MNLPTRRDLIGGFLPLLIAASGGMVGGVDVASPSVKLEYRFLPDETVAMTVSHRAHTETTISGTTQSTDTATDSRKRWRVVSVDAEGRATIEHSVDHVAMTSRISDRGEVRWNSDDGDQAPPGYETVRGSLGVPLSRVVIDRAGRVISRIDLQPTPPSASTPRAVPSGRWSWPRDRSSAWSSREPRLARVCACRLRADARFERRLRLCARRARVVPA